MKITLRPGALKFGTMTIRSREAWMSLDVCLRMIRLSRYMAKDIRLSLSGKRVGYRESNHGGRRNILVPRPGNDGVWWFGQRMSLFPPPAPRLPPARSPFLIIHV